MGSSIDVINVPVKIKMFTNRFVTKFSANVGQQMLSSEWSYQWLIS